MTDAAEASETSCSPDRPPKITPTRRGRMPTDSSKRARRDCYVVIATRGASAGPAALGAPLAPFREAAAELRFEAAVRRAVVLAPAQRLGQMLLIHAGFGA